MPRSHASARFARPPLLARTDPARYRADGPHLEDAVTSYALIANPASGSGRALRRARALQVRLAGSGADVRLLATRGRLSAAALAADVVGHVDRVVAVGGDGTLNEVVDGLMRRGLPAPALPELGFLPAGTGNAARRAFGLPSDPAAFVRALVEGRSTEIDVGIVRLGDVRRAFVLWAGAGWDAVLIEEMNAERSGGMGAAGLLRRAPRFLRALSAYAEPLIEVALDGRRFGPWASVIVANVGHLSFAGTVAHQADPADGLLDVVGVPAATVPGKLRLLGRMALTSLTRARSVGHARAREVVLRAAGAVPIHADGEPLGSLPARISIVPGAVRLLRTGAARRG